MSGLNNFMQKLTKYNKLGDAQESIVSAIAERGSQIARESYGDRKVEINIEKTGQDGKRKIVVKGKKLVFDEFGTGLVGEGTYPGKLPTKTFEFESPKGEPQRTQGWVYYYPNKKTKIMGGWFAGKVFHRGQVAKAQMFLTSQQLKEEMTDIAKETFKEGNK